jgi:hypothetical protein
MAAVSPALRKSLLVASAVLAVTGSGLAGFLLWQWAQPPRLVNGTVQNGCDLNLGPCLATFPGGGVLRVNVTPRPIPLLTPVTVEVQVSGLSAESVDIDLNSPDMYMGYNRHTLAPRNDGRFVGRTVLPVCVRDRMLWQLQVTARTRQGALGARFEFETVVAKGLRG